ncbi:MAG: hypothetical protein ACM3RX_07120 [Methanococcaceae archaeon]
MSKCCFVISPIGSDGSETRKRADQILKYVIEPAAKECGYDICVRADKLAEPGMITSQIIQHIVEDPLIIADLTEKNPNVFYELAIRHALRRPLVQIIKKGEPLPFDVANMRTIQVDHQDLDSVNEAKVEMIKQIKAVENKKPEEIETPISISLDLQLLKQSDKPEQRSLAELVSVIGSLRTDISSIDEKVNTNVKVQAMLVQYLLSFQTEGNINYNYWVPNFNNLKKSFTSDLLKNLSNYYENEKKKNSGDDIEPVPTN